MFRVDDLMGEDFKANQNHVGEHCWLCKKPIKEGQEIRYHGGPYIMHSECIADEIRRA